MFLRLKAGLKLQEEAEKREVEQGIHLLQDPQGIYHMEHECQLVKPLFLFLLPSLIT